MRAAGMRMAGRAGGNVVDQALSALSNIALSLAVARASDADTFGAFAIAFVVFGIGISLTKAGVGQVVQIRHGGDGPDDLRRAARGALGAAVLVGLLGSVGSVIAGSVTAGPLRVALFSLAIIFPALLLQDSCRMVFFAAGRSWSAALIDGIWAVVMFGLLAVLITRDVASLQLMVLAWGFGALVSALVGLRLLRVVPDLRRAPAWFVQHRDLTRYLLGEYVLGLGSMQIAILVVGVIAEASAVGSLRAAQVLLGPLAVVGVAAFQFSVPEVARRPELGTRGRRRFALGLSAFLGASTIVYVVLLLLLPDRLGVQLFGDSWGGASRVLLAMGVSSLFSSLANGPAGILYGMGLAANTFKINLAKGPVLLVSVLVSAWFAGAPGAAWALAATEAAVLPAWIFTLWRATRHDTTPPVHVEPDDAPVTGTQRSS